jgi:hypothetical protein
MPVAPHRQNCSQNFSTDMFVGFRAASAPRLAGREAVVAGGFEAILHNCRYR